MTANAIQRLADQLRARRAANPSPIRRLIEQARSLPEWEREPLPTPAPIRSRKRKPTLSAALTQAAKAGATVSGATIKPDGSVALTFGDGSTTTGNPWDEVLKNAAH